MTEKTRTEDSCSMDWDWRYIKSKKVKDACNKLYKNLNLAMPYASVKDKIMFQTNIQEAFYVFEKELGLKKGDKK